MQRKIWIILKVTLAIFLIFGGIQHFLKPDFYTPFVPEFLPFTMAIIYFSGLVEIIFGIALFTKKYAKFGAWGIFILMLAFLPIHIWDVFSDTPAIGSHKAALIRIPIQLILIIVSWKVISIVSPKKSIQ